MKRYCNRCVWHLPRVEMVKRDGTADNDICGQTLIIERDEVGNKHFKVHGDVQRCDECGQTLQDNRKVIYEKCAHKNKAMKCSTFKPKWYLSILFLGKRHD